MRGPHLTLFGALAALVIALAAGCGDSTGPVPVASVELSATDVLLDIGETVQLTATVRDAEGKPLDRAVAWSSNAAAVASVSASGLVTGLARGAAAISARVDGKVGVCVVVVQRPVHTVEVSPGSTLVDKGRTYRLQATPRDEDGNALDRAVEWASDDPDVATVDDAGLVTGVDCRRSDHGQQ